MKNLKPVFATLLILPLVLSCTLVFASSGMWSRIHEIGPVLHANSMIETSDGKYAIAGEFGTPGDFWLVKIDELGNIQWNRTYGGKEEDVAYSLVETSDGGYTLAGFTESFGQGEEDFWLVKTDANGNMQWNRTYGGADSDEAYSLVQTSDGGYALAGDGLFVKTDAYGNMEWNRTTTRDRARAMMIQTSDGGYALASRNWLIKTDSTGLTEWTKTYEENHIQGLVATFDGGYAMIGVEWLIKTDTYGNLEWSQTYGGSPLVATSDGGYAFISGSHLIKTDAQGNMEWNEGYETNRAPMAEWVFLNSVIETSDGGYAIAGAIFDWFIGDGLIWVIKTDEYGVIPEFPSWIILPLFLIATVVVVICRNRLIRKVS